MSNQELFEKIKGILVAEQKAREKSGKTNRSYNQKNNGLFIMIGYRNGVSSALKSPHLDARTFVDNMSFKQLRIMLSEVAAKFFVYEKKQEGKDLKEVVKKKK